MSRNDGLSPGKKTNTLVREMIHLAGVLMILCAVVAGILGFVNSITADHVQQLALEKNAAAMTKIIPGADFEPITDYPADDPVIRNVYGAYVNGQAAGLCIETVSQGFGGDMTIIVGIDLEGRILGVEITKMSETGGLGSNAANPVWLAQYAGKTGPLRVVKNTADGENDIIAITSSTVTSQAVTSGVQSALSFAHSYYAGGGLS